MRKIYILILVFIASFQMQSQTINWVGQSKSFIERQCQEANFKLFSDKEGVQKYEVTSIDDLTVFLVFYYKNGYCECQSIVGKCNENKSSKLENLMRKYFCESSEEIDSTHLKCDTTLANLKKSFGNGTFVYILYWINNEQ